MIRLPKGMTLEQLRKIRAQDKVRRYWPIKFRCPQCGQRFPCMHTYSDVNGVNREMKQ